MRNYKNEYVGYVVMATALRNEKIIGWMGIAAVIIFMICMFIAVFTSDFSIGSNKIDELFTEAAFVAGCVIAGALGAVFGLLITIKKADSKVFIGKLRGVLMVLSGVILVILGLIVYSTEGNEWIVYLFIIAVVLAAAADGFYNWVADQKIIMVISLFLALVMALTGILSQIGDNNIMGFLFVLFVAIWVLVVAAMRFAPIVEAEPEKQKGKKSKEKEKEAKKNAPAPRPYPAKKEAAPAPKKEVAVEKPIPKEEPKKVEEPKKEEPKAVEEPKVEPKKEEPKKEELPKLKVMSSREAAAARESARKKEEESAVEETPAEVPVPEPVAEEPVSEPEVDAGEEFDEDFEIMEDTPDALLRRATWNKGLRCRRDYGEHQIPIAFVKAKVAVYVTSEEGDTSIDDKLRSEGWVVFRYKEDDITDGKDQAEEINKAVKENLRAERAAKKKKSSKK